MPGPGPGPGPSPRGGAAPAPLPAPGWGWGASRRCRSPRRLRFPRGLALASRSLSAQCGGPGRAASGASPFPAACKYRAVGAAPGPARVLLRWGPRKGSSFGPCCILPAGAAPKTQPPPLSGPPGPLPSWPETSCSRPASASPAAARARCSLPWHLPPLRKPAVLSPGQLGGGGPWKTPARSFHSFFWTTEQDSSRFFQRQRAQPDRSSRMPLRSLLLGFIASRVCQPDGADPPQPP